MKHYYKCERTLLLYKTYSEKRRSSIVLYNLKNVDFNLQWWQMHHVLCLWTIIMFHLYQLMLHFKCSFLMLGWAFGSTQNVCCYLRVLSHCSRLQTFETFTTQQSVARKWFNLQISYVTIYWLISLWVITEFLVKKILF